MGWPHHFEGATLMSDLNADDARLLTAAEQELVGLTLHPAITGLSRHDLQALARRLREARDRARAIASQQRREMRGKAEPRGATPARDDAGTVAKEQVLADALKRVTEQSGRNADATDADATDAPAQAAEPAALLAAPVAAPAAPAADAPPAPEPAGGPPATGRSKKASLPRPTSKEAVAKPSKLSTVRFDMRRVGRVTKSVMSAQARRDSKPR